MMSQALIFYFNPSCSKSQKAFEILDQYNCSYCAVDYIKVGLQRQELADLVRILNVSAWDIVRHKDLDTYSIELNASSTQDQIFSALITHPILLQRPILLFNAKHGIIARPPEKIESFLESIKIKAKD
ncbi:hypothetical protein MRY82_07340 [bacterium]|nr:hypothetical protein [bacterium]